MKINQEKIEIKNLNLYLSKLNIVKSKSDPRKMWELIIKFKWNTVKMKIKIQLRK